MMMNCSSHDIIVYLITVGGPLLEPEIIGYKNVNYFLTCHEEDIYLNRLSCVHLLLEILSL